MERPIRTAFEAFKLDPLNPFDWRLLLYMLASVHFDVPKGKVGAPTHWSDKDWCQLLADYYAVFARHPAYKKSAVCRSMKKDKAFSGRYWFNKTPETIRRNVSRAFSPKHNRYIQLIDQFASRVISEREAAAKKAGQPWTKAEQLLARSAACEDMIPAIMALAARA
jgi:hypothetical protein